MSGPALQGPHEICLRRPHVTGPCPFPDIRRDTCCLRVAELGPVAEERPVLRPGQGVGRPRPAYHFAIEKLLEGREKDRARGGRRDERLTILVVGPAGNGPGICASDRGITRRFARMPRMYNMLLYISLYTTTCCVHVLGRDWGAW